tara:strand:- start:382 stop:582 length:201 start_codon:yes stop_codon:yes gene_type:complete
LRSSYRSTHWSAIYDAKWTTDIPTNFSYWPTYRQAVWAALNSALFGSHWSANDVSYSLSYYLFATA